MAASAAIADYAKEKGVEVEQFLRALTILAIALVLYLGAIILIALAWGY